MKVFDKGVLQLIKQEGRHILKMNRFQIFHEILQDLDLMMIMINLQILIDFLEDLNLKKNI